MTKPTYDQEFWESLWAKTLREQGAKVAGKPPNGYLVAAAKSLRPGRALDAGCGHGAETLWLAAHGWRVTGVDFSAAALEHARSMAVTAGQEIAERIAFIEADLGTWAPEAGAYDLVVSLYVHVAGSAHETVLRLAGGVAPGGMMLLVGHQPIDPATGAATAAAGQNQVSVESARSALDPRQWKLEIAEERPRSAGSGVDAVIQACRVG